MSRAACLIAFLLLAVVGGLPASAAAALPRVEIDVAQRVVDDPKKPAQMRIRGPGGYRGRIGIELRGSSSLRFDKKSYALETRSRGSKSRNAALLGMPAENDWILNGARSDRTFSRDALAYATARRIGRWAPRTRFVELYINRRYQGVYVLTEQVKLDAARVAVPRAGITGGYIVEGSTTPFARGFRGAVSGRFYDHKDPKREQLRADEAGWIAGYVAAAEVSLAARDGAWRGLVDEAAAVDYLLLQELFMNLDAYNRSTFLAKGADRPLVFGPVWDFDRSMGLDLSGGFSIAPHGSVSNERPLARDLLADVAFTQRLAARWSQLRAKDLLRGMLRQLDRSRRVLRAPQARDARRWPANRSRSHASEMRRLRAWLIDRVRWMDANIATLAGARVIGGT